VSCESDLQGGCEIACKAPEGAIFCNGEWINTDDLDACASAIEDAFTITVTGYAHGSCSGDSCEAEAGVSAKCSTANPGSEDFNYGFMGLGVVGLGIAAARRRKK
jgi:hypothetical protein